VLKLSLQIRNTERGFWLQVVVVIRIVNMYGMFSEFIEISIKLNSTTRLFPKPLILHEKQVLL